MNKIVLSSLGALVALAAAAAPAAAVPTQVSFAGRLTTDAGAPVDGDVDLTFRLYDGASVVWEEDHDVDADDGLVFVALGSDEPLDAAVFDGGPLQLEIVIDGEPATPRLALASVPYAVAAGLAEDAMLLEGQPASAFAPASHDHGGVYAPASHDHDGDYLPIGATLSCAGTQKVSALNPNGSVTCSADLDANTTYGVIPGDGLELVGTNFGIATGGVTATHLATGAVASDELASNAVTAGKIATGAVGSAQIADGSIAAADIATDAVGSSEIATGAVGASEIAGSAIRHTHIDNNWIQSDRDLSPTLCNTFETIAFSPAFAGTPAVTMTVQGAAGTNSYCMLNTVSTSSFSYCCIGNPGDVHWMAVYAP